MRLSGKVAVVVPGTFGVGHDTAIRFAVEGAKVVLGGESDENGRKTLEAISRAGGEARFERCDLLKEADVARLIGAALARFGRLDAIFGCPDYYLNGTIEHQTAADFDYSLWYNCRSLFFLAKHAIQPMLAQGGGSVIYLTSAYAQVSGSASCTYEVSKGIVVNLTRSFAERYSQKRVRFNCIAAGHTIEPPRDLRDEIPTYLVRDAGEVERLTQFYPAGRLAVPDDIARAAVFLASDESGYTTGAVLPVEGGFVIR